MNRIQRILQARIKSLLLEAEAAATVDHNSTTGALREGYLRKFLTDITPWGISLTGGVMIDLLDAPSPQVDLIASLNSLAPRLLFDETTSMVPVEAVLMALEVKSELKQYHLDDQLRRQNDWIAKRVSWLNFHHDIPKNWSILPTAVVAFGCSKNQKDRTLEWMSSSEATSPGANTSFCCIINQFYLRKGHPPVQADGQFSETLAFLSDYIGGLEMLGRWRREAMALYHDGSKSASIPHPMEYYLKGLGSQLPEDVLKSRAIEK